MRLIVTTFCTILLAANITTAQIQSSIQSSLQNLITEGAKGYAQPIAAGFLANMNGAWFDDAPPARKFGFVAELGMVGMTANVPLDQTFVRTAQYQLNADQARQALTGVTAFTTLPSASQNDILRLITQRNLNVQISGPTVIGKQTENVNISISASQQDRTFTTTVGGRTVTVEIPANQSIALDVKGLLNPRDYFLNAVPFAAPQLTIGTFMGTRGVVRFVPNLSNWIGVEKLGDISMFGWGIQHNPLTWFFADSTALPINIGLNFYNQSFRITQAVRAVSNSYGASASWTFGGAVLALTPYAGYLMENSLITVDYQYQPRTANGQLVTDINGQVLKPVPINFMIEGENTSRIILGLGLRVLSIVDVSAEVNLGNRYTTLNASASVRLGNDAPR